MRKSYLLPIIIGFITLGLSYYVLSKSGKGTTDFTKTLRQAGKPDQIENEDLAQLENAKMVSEGSQFGVQYYNKTAKEEKAAYENK